MEKIEIIILKLKSITRLVIEYAGENYFQEILLELDNFNNQPSWDKLIYIIEHIESWYNRNTVKIQTDSTFGLVNLEEHKANYNELLKLKEQLLLNSAIYKKEINNVSKQKIELESNTNSINNLELIFDRFQKVANQLENRYSNRETLKIKDEYDVQNLLHSLLLLNFDDIRVEEWTPSFAGTSARQDFLLKNEKTVIEVKMTRKGLGNKEATEQLIIDIAKYKTHPDCKSLICFVYDPNGSIKNPRGFEQDIMKTEKDLDVKVYVRPM